MCGRYQFNITDSNKGKKIKSRCAKLNLIYKQGEIFPSDKVLCVVKIDSKIDLDVKYWGIKKQKLIINARYETIDDRLTFKEIKNNRCAVICNGFYEWDKDKHKYYITSNMEYMYLACIYNNDDELVIITTSSDDNFKDIHDRSPIIMNEEEMKAYLNNENKVFTKKDLNIELVDMQTSLF